MDTGNFLLDLEVPHNDEFPGLSVVPAGSRHGSLHQNLQDLIRDWLFLETPDTSSPADKIENLFGFHLSPLGDILYAAKTEPVGSIGLVFGRPANRGAHEGGAAEETTSAHGQVPFDPNALAHLPNISGHVITSIGTYPQMESGDIGHPVEAQLGGVAIAGIEIVSPRPPSGIGSPGCFFPLRFSGETLPRPGGVGPGVSPSQANHWLEWFIPSIPSPEERRTVPGLLDEPAILVVGHWMEVDVIIFQGYLAGRNFGHEDRILGAV